MFPGINLNYLNSPEFQAYVQQLRGGGGFGMGSKQAYTPSGQMYNGPFGNDTRTPFRTVAPASGGFQPAYNRGLNASSAQLYDHFRAKPGMNATDFNLYGAGATQSFEDFANRGALAAPDPQVAPEGEAVPPPNPGTNAAYQGLGRIPNIFRYVR
jgi:hypothetical protein